jgi:hypothetical protein
VFAANNRMVGVTGTQVENKGTIVQQSPSMTTQVLCDFQNYGEVQVVQGVLAVAEGTNWHSISVQPGASLLIISGTAADAYVFDTSSTVTVRGDMRVSGGNLIMFGAYDAAGGRTTVASGMFDLRYQDLVLIGDVINACCAHSAVFT